MPKHPGKRGTRRSNPKPPGSGSNPRRLPAGELNPRGMHWESGDGRKGNGGGKRGRRR